MNHPLSAFCGCLFKLVYTKHFPDVLYGSDSPLLRAEKKCYVVFKKMLGIKKVEVINSINYITRNFVIYTVQLVFLGE